MKKNLLKNKISGNIIILPTLILFSLLVVFFVPLNTQAISIEIESQNTPNPVIKKGDTVIFNVYIKSSEKEEINAIDGEINLSENLTPKYLSVAGSVFDLWPNKPVFEDRKIIFAGGTASGVYGSKIKLLSFAVEASDVGNASVSSNKIDGFLNDGFGTKIIIDKFDKIIKIEELNNSKNINQLDEKIRSDKNKPQAIEVLIGKEKDVFDGKFFMFFFAKDDGVGIEGYEILENNEKTIQNDNVYIIKDQSLKSKIKISAIDKSGNTKKISVNPHELYYGQKKMNWSGLLISVLLLFVVFFIVRVLNRRKKHNVQ